MIKDIEKQILNKMGKISKREINRSISTCCLFVCHQPLVPKAVRNLKRKSMNKQ